MYINIHISLIIIGIICLFWSWYMLRCCPKLNKQSFKSSSFKTGDMILFHAWNNINPIFIGSFWGHVGIVYNDPYNSDPPLIFEAAATKNLKECDDFNKSGIMITDLKTRLEKYPGLIACKFLNNPLENDVIKGFYDFMIYAKKNMCYNHDIIKNSFNKLTGEIINTSVNCGEITALSLIKLGLVSMEDVLYKKKPHHLLYVCHIQNMNNNKYLQPVELTFNPF